jgi:hypothetical protein
MGQDMAYFHILKAAPAGAASRECSRPAAIKSQRAAAQEQAIFSILKKEPQQGRARKMHDLLLFLIISGGGALALAAAYLAFEILLFTLYKISGGRRNIISYFRRLAK